MADKNKYRILVTGGAGFIGSNLVDRLIKEGNSVVVIDNLSTGNVEFLSPMALFYQQDIRDYDVLEKIFETHKFDYVFHLAAQISVPDSVKDPNWDAEINMMGTLNLLKLAVKYGIKKFVFSSTGGAIYGDNAPIPTSEDYCPHPISPYAISKFACEKYIEFYSRQHDLNYTILRYANVYGPKQTPKGEAGVVAIFTQNMLEKKEIVIYGDGEQVRDFVHVFDVVEANFLSMNKGDKETINISTNKKTTVNELFEAMKRKTGYENDPVYKPERDGDVKISLLSNAKANSILGWEPKYDLEKGVENTIEWYTTSL